MRVLAIGECMAEFAPAAGPGDYRLGFAGDTFNTAWYLARLCPDVEVSYFTAVGTDAISRQMLDAFAAGGVGSEHVRQIPDRTVGLYMIALNQGERSFSYWRTQSAARCLADDPGALASAIAHADIIYFSGITLAILSPQGRSNLLAALTQARGAGRTIGFDPNLRPRLWSDRQEMTSAIMEGAGVCDLALPSFEDEAEWFGDAGPEDTAARYALAGAGQVIVKNGSRPVLFRDGNDMGTVEVQPLTQVVDTTAAGDSFNAGFLAGHALPMRDAITQACAVAARVVMGKGALVPIDRSDVIAAPR